MLGIMLPKFHDTLVNNESKTPKLVYLGADRAIRINKTNGTIIV